MSVKFHLLYDEADKEFVNGKLSTLLGDLIEKTSVAEEYIVQASSNDKLLLFLSDQQIKGIFSVLVKKGIPFAVLPHRQAPHICGGLGVNTNMAKAIEFLRKQEEAMALDVLFCNRRPVFNHIVIGDTFQLVAKKPSYPLGFLRRSKAILGRFFSLRPFPLEIEFKNSNKTKTVASGAIIVQHRQSSLLSRLIPGDFFIREGMLHAFILSPRSFTELFKFTINSFLKKEYFPDFGAHIKTNKLKFICPQKGRLTFTEDGESFREEVLDLEVRKELIQIYPGEGLNLSKDSKEPSEIYKVNSLPTGEAVANLVNKPLPIIRSATTEEFKDLFQVLRENAQTKSSYLVLMVLSTILATFGLFANSTPVVIGAMILAPLMAPIITLSMATLRQDKKLIFQSSATIMSGMGLAFLFAVVITWLTPISTANAEILARIRPTLLDLGVAVVSGIAGAYAHAREEIAKTLAGVAIAVALVPPLAVSAIGFGWGDISIFWGAALLLFTNLAGIVLAGALTFLLLGFSPFRLATRGVIISLTSVIILSIPLAIGFNQMVYEHNTVNKLDGIESNGGTIRDVRVQRLRPMSLAIRVVSEEPLSGQDLDAIKERIEQKLDQPIHLEISTAIRR